MKLQVNRESDPGRASKGNDPTTEFYQFVQRGAFRTSMAASRQIQERASAAVTSRLPSVTASPTCRAGRLLAASAAHGSPGSGAPRAAAWDVLTYSMRARDANLPQARKGRLEALVTLSVYNHGRLCLDLRNCDGFLSTRPPGRQELIDKTCNDLRHQNALCNPPASKPARQVKNGKFEAITALAGTCRAENWRTFKRADRSLRARSGHRVLTHRG